MAERVSIRFAAEPVAETATLLASAVAEVTRERGSARLAIPGGSALRAVGPARRKLGECWRRVRLTWTDERCVAFSHPASNRGAAFCSGALTALDAPADTIALYEDDDTPASAVARAEGALAERFHGALDVVLLGLGEDGHVASLFPGLPVREGALVAWMPGSPKPPADRITLTLRMLTTAPHTFLLATGEAKRRALERFLAGDSQLAASSLRGAVVITDLAQVEGASS